ncbi:MAG: cysteine desulfurase [Candidatus Eremiobacteraeota bacterium]|nr:cysteine desulfurase [Candidatus Eremiobacteraeota bacterium]
MTRIYLDHAATTPVRREVLDAMLPFLEAPAYNPSSLHAEGRAARDAVDRARDTIAACIGALRKEIVFTSGGSEADTLALVGAAKAARGRKHVVVSAIEHHAVLHAARALVDDGFDVTTVTVDANGVVEPAAFSAALRDDTAVASIMYANNELGTIQPIRELGTLAHERGALFHTDAVQAATFLRMDVSELGVDMLTLSAHKYYGPKGVGALYVRSGTPVIPIVHGGSQEFSLRAGTENVAGIAGFACALELAVREAPIERTRLATLRERLESLLLTVDGIRVNGAAAPRLPHISNCSFLGVESEQLLLRLDLEGVAVSSGSACASGTLEPSHVVAALGLPDEWMRAVIRFSLGHTTSEEQVDRAAQVTLRALADLRAISSLPT